MHKICIYIIYTMSYIFSFNKQIATLVWRMKCYFFFHCEQCFQYVCFRIIYNSIKQYAHSHTHIYISDIHLYVYIYIHMCVCVCLYYMKHLRSNIITIKDWNMLIWKSNKIVNLDVLIKEDNKTILEDIHQLS